MYWLTRLNRDKRNLIDQIKIQNKELLHVNEQLQNSSGTISTQNKLLKSKNEELGNFVFIASHDLKSPIRSLLNYTELLELKLKDKLSPKESELIHIIKSSGNNMYSLVNDLLDFARLDEGRINQEKVNVLVTINRTLDNLVAEIEN